MVNVQKTEEIYSYKIEELKPSSCKFVIWNCDSCDIEKIKKFVQAKRNSICLLCSNKINANKEPSEQKSKRVKEYYLTHQHPLLGTKRPQYVIDAMIKGNKERIRTPEERKLFGERSILMNKNRIWSEESKQKASEAHKKTTKRGKECNFYGKNYNVPLSTQEFVRRAKERHGELYNYDKTDYKGTIHDVVITCKIHGDFTQKAFVHISGCGCNKCNSSKAELFIEEFLVKNNVDFKVQHKFKDCKYKNVLPFDFYIESINTCIEYDGEFHSKDMGFNNLSLQKIRDKVKTDYCIKNNIKLLRIHFKDFKSVEQILTDNIILPKEYDPR